MIDSLSIKKFYFNVQATMFSITRSRERESIDIRKILEAIENENSPISAIFVYAKYLPILLKPPPLSLALSSAKITHKIINSNAFEIALKSLALYNLPVYYSRIARNFLKIPEREENVYIIECCNSFLYIYIYIYIYTFI